MNAMFSKPADRLRTLFPRRPGLSLAAACVFAFSMALSFGSTASNSGCNVQCERYCFTQFVWCGGFFNEQCYPQYVECASGCGCFPGE